MISEMYDIKSIENDIESDLPIAVMNAIIQTVLHKCKTETIIRGLEKQADNRTSLLGLQIGEVAIAAMAVLGIKDYTGDSASMRSIISDFQKMLDSEREYESI